MKIGEDAGTECQVKARLLGAENKDYNLRIFCGNKGNVVSRLADQYLL